jgi:arginine utilization regulatory protein
MRKDIQNHAGQTPCSFDSMVGQNAMFRRAIDIARAAAAGPSPILICGATGTGKELFARSIHGASPWFSGPYMTVNCAAIPSTLLEGILFGTEKGAFTGAIDKKGLFEEADAGVARQFDPQERTRARGLEI